ncbi:MAG: hypothetical protein ACOZAO_03830 [Patescibacteria group bacterium]
MIEIINLRNIKSSKNRANIAYLVDNTDFLHEVERLRKKWKLKPKKAKVKTHKFKAKLSYEESVEFENDINEIRIKFARTYPYFDVISDAVIYGKVFDDSYVPTMLQERMLQPPNLKHPELFLNDKEYMIVITPESSQLEVEQCFKEFENKRNRAVVAIQKGETNRDSSYIGYYAEHSKIKKEIDRDRSLYWFVNGPKLLQGINITRSKKEIEEFLISKCPKKSKHTASELKDCIYCNVALDSKSVEKALARYTNNLALYRHDKQYS